MGIFFCAKWHATIGKISSKIYSKGLNTGMAFPGDKLNPDNIFQKKRISIKKVTEIELFAYKNYKKNSPKSDNAISPVFAST